MSKSDSEVDLANVVLNSNSGAIDRWSCKKCRKNILLELLLMLGVPVGGILGYGYAVIFITLYFKIPIYLRIDKPEQGAGLFVALAFFGIWFLTCKIAFAYVESLTWDCSWEHDKSHNEIQSQTGVE